MCHTSLEYFKLLLNIYRLKTYPGVCQYVVHTIECLTLESSTDELLLVNLYKKYHCCFSHLYCYLHHTSKKGGAIFGPPCVYWNWIIFNEAGWRGGSGGLRVVVYLWQPLGGATGRSANTPARSFDSIRWARRCRRFLTAMRSRRVRPAVVD